MYIINNLRIYTAEQYFQDQKQNDEIDIEAVYYSIIEDSEYVNSKGHSENI